MIRNVLLVFDDAQGDRTAMIQTARDWAQAKSKTLDVIEINPNNPDRSPENQLDILVTRKLHESIAANEEVNLAVISGGSSNVSNYNQRTVFGKGFIDVLHGLNSFLENHRNLKPYVMLRSSWFGQQAANITEKIQAFSGETLSKLLESLTCIPRVQDNYNQVKTATTMAVNQAPDHITTIGKPNNLDLNFTPDQKTSFLNFLDHVFKS